MKEKDKKHSTVEDKEKNNSSDTLTVEDKDKDISSVEYKYKERSMENKTVYDKENKG